MSQRKPSASSPGGENPAAEGQPGQRAKDSYDGSKSTSGGKLAQAEAAPEVSRGAWRERAFVPRGTMPPAQVLSEMERELQVACMQQAPIAQVRAALKGGWAPLLRQAVEQGGGDGIDALLRKMLKRPGPAGLHPLVGALCASMQRLNQLQQVAELSTEANGVMEAVAKAIEPASARRVSLKVLERELEGRIDLDALLEVLFSNEAELSERLEGVERTLESLRAQLRGMPGVQPDGMYSNYTRLKVEKRVIEAELLRRKG